MLQYFFILGRNPPSSIAEILSVVKLPNIPPAIVSISPEVLIIRMQDSISANELIQRLGGTIKIGKVISEAGLDEDEKEFQKIFLAENIVNNFLAKREGKVHFGISVYDGGGDKNYLNKITEELKTLNITIKENLREKGIKGGFVRIKERTLSSVSVSKNRLLSHGAEIVLILTRDKILIGKTLAVQEFESFSFRDYGRPERDKRSGIIPPKLARMMINLASVGTSGILLDPFCGSGTILQEAIILGYKKIVGSDISPSAISDTRKNIDWLFTHFRNIDKTFFNIDIFSADIRNITAKLKPNSIDAIVTEPYLGPPLYKKPDLESVMKIFDEVGKLYLDAFNQFHKILKTDGTVIFLFPTFEISGKMQFMPILDKIKKMGFEHMRLLPDDIAENPAIDLTSRNTIIYGGREHFVKREITSWRKV